MAVLEAELKKLVKEGEDMTDSNEADILVSF
jgi:hypothetical protein